MGVNGKNRICDDNVREMPTGSGKLLHFWLTGSIAAHGRSA